MRRRTLEDVPVTIDLETNGEVWATVPLSVEVRLDVLALARREHQSIEVAYTRLLLRAFRARIKRWEAEQSTGLYQPRHPDWLPTDGGA